ncbi:MAG: DUF4097 domain-containing protein [candidate division KSB1 bacterium]|jgi:DUF4097 and DUF4098 domain-containing protein YvlB|nr:DUF4097 domain-containing protein [candidate division KSB1 bacterium]
MKPHPQRFVVAALLLCLALTVIPRASMGQKLSKQGRRWVAEIETTFAVQPGGQLRMHDISGDVGVRTWDKPEVYILERRRMDVFTKEEAEEALKRAKVGYRHVGNTVEVDGSEFLRRWMESSFEVHVPVRFDVEVRTSGGDLALSDLKGTIKLRTAGGDIAVRQTVGDAELSTSGGDITIDGNDGVLSASTAGGDIRALRITQRAKLTTSGGNIELGEIGGTVEASTAGGDIVVRDCKGSARVKTSGGDITLVNVGGEADATTSGGDIEVRGSTGAVKASTSGGDVVLFDIGGPISAKTAGGDIRSQGVKGGVQASTSGGDINLRGVQGFIEASTAGGDIYGEMTLADFSQDHHVRMKTSGGEVTLVIPERLPASVHAVLKITDRATDKYEILSDFALTIKEEQGTEWGRRIAKAIIATGELNGGGDPIEIETTNGNIRLKKLRKP